MTNEEQIQVMETQFAILLEASFAMSEYHRQMWPGSPYMYDFDKIKLGKKSFEQFQASQKVCKLLVEWLEAIEEHGYEEEQAKRDEHIHLEDALTEWKELQK